MRQRGNLRGVGACYFMLTSGENASRGSDVGEIGREVDKE